MSILAALLIGLFVGFLVGGGLIFSDHKEKVRIGQVPYIDKSGRLSWKAAPLDAHKSKERLPGDRLYREYDPTLDHTLYLFPARTHHRHSSSNCGRNKTRRR